MFLDRTYPASKILFRKHYANIALTFQKYSARMLVECFSVNSPQAPLNVFENITK